MSNKKKVEKPKLRLIFNFILWLFVILYIILVFMNYVNNYSILGYLALFYGITIIRDIVAPKKKNEKKEI